MSDIQAPGVVNLFEAYQDTWTDRQKAGFNALPMAFRMAVREAYQHPELDMTAAVYEWEQFFKHHPLTTMDDGEHDRGV